MSQVFTCVYSSHSLLKVKELVNYFMSEYTDTGLTFDDMFYAGVFCKRSTYANYDGWDMLPDSVEEPEPLVSICVTEQERLNYVEEVITAVVKGEIPKPEWMIEIEGTAICDEESAMSPSTYLLLVPKSAEHEELGNRLLEFLYSLNILSTLLDED